MMKKIKNIMWCVALLCVGMMPVSAQNVLEIQCRQEV